MPLRSPQHRLGAAAKATGFQRIASNIKCASKYLSQISFSRPSYVRLSKVNVVTAESGLVESKTTYRFSLEKGVAAAPVLKLELPDPETAQAKANELARILAFEASRTHRLIDHDILRVTDNEGHLVLVDRIDNLLACPKASS